MKTLWKLRKRKLKRAARAFRSIYFSFFSLMLGVVVFVLAITTGFSVTRSVTHNNELMASSLNQMRLSIESASFAHLRYHHYIELEVFLRGLMVENDARGIFLEDPVNNLKIALGDSVPNLEQNIEQVKLDQFEIEDFKTSGVAALYFPLFVENQLRGAVAIVVDRPTLFYHVKKAIIDYLGIAAIVALMMAPVCAKATRSIVRPIKTMTGMSKQMGLGGSKFSYDAFTGATVEARTLAGSLARASNRIDNQNRRINSQMKIIKQHAYNDEVTGLANRNRFRMYLEEAIISEQPFAIGLIDLDRFKQINDTLGHDVGDYVLHISAKRMEDTVRSCGHGANALVARLGGDEFAFVVKGLNVKNGQDQLLSAMNDALRQAINVGAQDVYVSGSIGVAAFPIDGKDYTTILKASDLAMYEAKKAGRDTYRLFQPRMMVEIQMEQEFAGEIDDALKNDDILPFYQPILDLNTGAIRGVEALARWHHAERGILAPKDFFAVAQETGRMAKIDAKILDQACRDAANWAERYPQLYVAVNLSNSVLCDVSGAGTIAETLARTGLKPDLLSLELSEKDTLSKTDDVAGALKALHAKGIKLAVDDYGAGHSNLAELTRLPFQVIKIDQSMVVGMMEDAKAKRLLTGLIAMAHDLGFETLAEGVETQAELDALREIGCTMIQGFIVARAMPHGKLQAWLENANSQNPMKAHVA